MTAMNKAAHIAAELSKDTGYVSTTVHIDPNKWSSRRRNIVVRALNDGITSCGSDTAYFIDALTQAYGGRVQTMSKWDNNITTDCVKEEEVDNLIAYTCAWIRLKAARQSDHFSYGMYRLDSFVNLVSCGVRPETIPAPEIKGKALSSFIKQYLKSNEEITQLRQDLAQKIERGEQLTINLQAK